MFKYDYYDYDYDYDYDGDDDDDDDDHDPDDDDDDDGDGDDQPRKENEDPGKEAITKLVGDGVVQATTEKDQGLIRILETTTFQSPAELLKTIKNQTDNRQLLKTIKNQTDKQSHPKPNTDPWMEPLEVDQDETFADIIQRYTDVIQQQDNTPVIVPPKELEEAVQNICDL